MDGLRPQPYKDKGYWAIILGGSSGMGWAAAQQLAKSGMNLCLVYRERRSRLKEIQPKIDAWRESGIIVLTFNKDAGSAEAMQSIIDELKAEMRESESVRLLLHSVARGNLKPMLANDSEPELNSEDFQLTIDAMAMSWYRWAKAILKESLFSADARLLAFTSEGSQRAWPGYGAVAAAKSTLESLMRNMALEMAPAGIRCNVLQPGVTDTTSLRMIPGSEQMITESKRRNPFNRLTEPEDVAKVVDLLCRDESAWINGAIIPVDGGESISG